MRQTNSGAALLTIAILLSWAGLAAWGASRASRGPVFWATTSFVLSQTVYVPTIGQALAELTRSPYSCNQFMNVWGLLSALAVLACFIERNRVHWTLFGVVAVLSTVGLFVLAAVEVPSPVGCIASLDVGWTSGYWWLLNVIHVVSSAWAAFEISRYAIVAWATPDRLFASGLTMFGVAFTASTVFWLLMTAVQVTEQRSMGAATSATVFPITVFATTTALTLAASAQLRAMWITRQTLAVLYRRCIAQERSLHGEESTESWSSVVGKWWNAPDETIHRLSVRIADNNLSIDALDENVQGRRNP